MAQLTPLPLAVSCFSKIYIGFAFLVPAHPGSPGKRAVKQLCVYACVRACVCVWWHGSADIQSPQHLDAFVPATPNQGSRTRPKPAIDHYGAVSTFHDDNICETRFSMLCTSCLELTTANCSQYSDSVAVFKLRLKTFLFSQAFSSFSAH